MYPEKSVLRSGKIYEDCSKTRQPISKRNQLGIVPLKEKQDESPRRTLPRHENTKKLDLNIQKYFVQDGLINFITQQGASNSKDNLMPKVPEKCQSTKKKTSKTSPMTEVQGGSSIRKKNSKAKPKPKSKKNALKISKKICKAKVNSKKKKGGVSIHSNRRTEFKNYSNYIKHIYWHILSQSWGLIFQWHKKKIIASYKKNYPYSALFLKQRNTDKKLAQKELLNDIEDILTPKSFSNGKNKSSLDLESNLQANSTEIKIKKCFSRKKFFQFLKSYTIKEMRKYMLKLLLKIIRKQYIIYLIKSGKMIDEYYYFRTKYVLIQAIYNEMST